MHARVFVFLSAPLLQHCVGPGQTAQGWCSNTYDTTRLNRLPLSWRASGNTGLRKVSATMAPNFPWIVGRPVCLSCYAKMYSAARKPEAERPEPAPDILPSSSSSAVGVAASTTVPCAHQTQSVFRSIERSRRLRPNNPQMHQPALMFWEQ